MFYVCLHMLAVLAYLCEGVLLFSFIAEHKEIGLPRKYTL